MFCTSSPVHRGGSPTRLCVGHGGSKDPSQTSILMYGAFPPSMTLPVGLMVKRLRVGGAQTLARVKAVEPAVSAIAQRDQLGLRVSNRRYEGALRTCGAAGDWPAVNRLSQHLRVRLCNSEWPASHRSITSGLSIHSLWPPAILVFKPRLWLLEGSLPALGAVAAGCRQQRQRSQYNASPWNSTWICTGGHSTVRGSGGSTPLQQPCMGMLLPLCWPV